ncbi:MAG: response regulator [Aureispira sp.]|nr:response regulator [Aureispira sp.]
MSNAIKFTPRSGKITLTITETNTHLNIQVSDTGKGVHPNDLPYIFERFYQSKQAEQKLYGGTGIGLALVNEFAALMEGKAYATSTLGEGSQFYFELPKKVVEPQTTIISTTVIKEEIELIESIGTDFTILVVEDNPDMRAFVSQLLQERYQTVLTAQNGAEGLEKLKEYGTKIHLIVSDVMMPEVDGIALLQTIKSTAAWRSIPVIMLTALAAERDKLKALTIGVDDYLTKPFSVSELLIRVQNLLYNYHQRLTIAKEEKGEPKIKAEQKQETTNSKIDKEWIAKIEEFIKESIAKEPVNVESLAKFVLLSKRQLTRKLKALIGLTPAKFIREVQLQMARKDLESGSFISVSEVAYNNGFDNPNNFSTMFKNHFGKTPSSYLK